MYDRKNEANEFVADTVEEAKAEVGKLFADFLARTDESSTQGKAASPASSLS